MCNSSAAVKDLQWSSPLQIIKYPDPRLRAVNARIGTFDSKVEQLGKELLEVMYNGYVSMSLEKWDTVAVLQSACALSAADLCLRMPG